MCFNNVTAVHVDCVVQVVAIEPWAHTAKAFLPRKVKLRTLSRACAVSDSEAYSDSKASTLMT